MIRILRVLAPNPGPFTLDGTNTWIVGENPAIVIDPGPDDAGHLLAVMDAAGPIAEILVTHDHPDHQPGAERLAHTVALEYRAHRPGPGGVRLHDGEEVVAGQARLRSVFTPGHAADHTAFHMEAEAALFTGDAVLGRGTSVIDPPEGDLAAYLRSLAAMLALEPRTIYPGHGPAVFDAPRKLREYLDHRALREEQVLEALRGGPKTPEDIVPGIYTGEVGEEMFPVAARSVLAHLLKLEREGRAVRTRPVAANRFELAEVRECERCGRRRALPRARLCERCSMALLQESPAGE